jgi:uncharacterized membrane protein
MLDPTRDYLIILFPEGFWFDAALLFGQITIGVAGTLLAVSLVYLRRTRKKPPGNRQKQQLYVKNASWSKSS